MKVDLKAGVGILVMVAAMCTGCTKSPVIRLYPEKLKTFVAVQGATFGAYVIDPNTESCFITIGWSASEVDCGKLRRSVPETAEYMPWLGGRK